MATSSRFAVSVHVLSALALSEDPVASNQLAKSASTGAVVIRQLLGRLRSAGLVACRLGKGGGAFLTRPPAEITLLEIFDAVESPQIFCTHRCAPSTKCVVGRNVLEALSAVTDRAEAALRAELEAVTLQQMVEKIWAMKPTDQPCQGWSIDNMLTVEEGEPDPGT